MSQPKQLINLIESNKSKKVYLVPEISHASPSTSEFPITSLGDRRRSTITKPGSLSIIGLISSKRFAKQLADRMVMRRGTIKTDIPFVKQEPTYRLEPHRKFGTADVVKVIKETLDNYLKDAKYDKTTCAKFAEEITDDIKLKVKQLGFDRYKIVVSVVIGEKCEQGVAITSRCAWDVKLDNQATYTYNSTSLFCTATVFGLYFE